MLDAFITLFLLVTRSAGVFLSAGFSYDCQGEKSKHADCYFAEGEVTKFMEHCFFVFVFDQGKYKSNLPDFQTLVNNLP